MSYKTIVIHLDTGPRCALRVDLAAGLAAAHGSHLVGIAATGRPDVIVTMNSAVPDHVEGVALSAAYLRERAAELARSFERQCVAAGVSSYEARVVDDAALDAVVRHGRCSDLVVVGQTDRRSGPFGVEGVATDFPQQVLLHSGAPVLLVPCAGAFRHVGRRALVAWKDTREAARALRDALPMLRSAERVVLLEIGEAGTRPSAEGAFDAARAWLASHGVAADARFETSAIDIGDELLSRAADLDADLIVMGGYGRSRVREWVLGGATRHLLAQMTAPTLMSH
jgi:nucleotide-binding universal stress UspA family protein